MKNAARNLLITLLTLWALAPAAWSAPLNIDRIEHPSVLRGGEATTAVLHLTAPASTPVYVHLSSVPGLYLPGTVVVPAGESSVAFPMTARTVPSSSEYRLTASAGVMHYSGSIAVWPSSEPVRTAAPAPVGSYENSLSVDQLPSAYAPRYGYNYYPQYQYQYNYYPYAYPYPYPYPVPTPVPNPNQPHILPVP